MTASEMMQAAVAKIESKPGYHYSREIIGEIVGRGLRVGDSVRAANGTMTYVGDGMIRIQPDAGVAIDRAADELAQQRFLVAVAVAKSQLGSQMGTLGRGGY